MREILFRGKHKGKWIYGSLISLDADSGYVFICEPYLSASTLPVKELISQNITLVDRETVGQYTGLRDKSGERIFEGDIVCCWSQADKANCVVIFESGEFHLVPAERYKKYSELSGFHAIRCFVKEVIGSIYDNPELLN